MSTLANIPEHEEYLEKEAEYLNKGESWIWDPSSGISEATWKEAISDVADITNVDIPKHEEYREKEAEYLNKGESWIRDPSSGVSEATWKDAFSDFATDVSNEDTESVLSNNSFRWELEVVLCLTIIILPS